MNIKSYIPELENVVDEADWIDVKSIEASGSLRQFISGVAAWLPWWVKILYMVRTLLAPLFSIRIVGIPSDSSYAPEAVPFEPGAKAMFGHILSATEERYWAIEADDSHLKAVLAIIREPLPESQSRFFMVTIAQFHNWQGRLYLNVIKPFHHLLLKKMLLAGAAAAGNPKN